VVPADRIAHDVQIWGWKDRFEGDKWEVRVGRRQYEMGVHDTVDYNTNGPIIENDIERMRDVLSRTEWDGEYSQALAQGRSYSE